MPIMKLSAFKFFLLLGLVLVLITRPNAQAAAESHGPEMQLAKEDLIAIDVLLEPDQTMVDKSNASNARLRANYSAGYALDATHTPHVTMLQRYVRVKDLDAVTTALTKLFTTERPTELQLKAKGYEYTIWSGVAVTVFVVERTPELIRLQQKVSDTVAPYSVSGGSSAAFIETPSNSEIVGYVEQFVPKSSGDHYSLT
jgi:hypothetical protein